jgi:hypothetical protein
VEYREEMIGLWLDTRNTRLKKKYSSIYGTNCSNIGTFEKGERILL